jgi:DNA-binding MarR family transcriptional regulator
MTAPRDEHDHDRTANILGALALVVTDRMTDAIEDASAHAATGATALSALHHFMPPEPSIDLLRQVLGLTHSGTVRLVDRLEEAGHVRRGPGPDGRTTTVRLTPAGRRAARSVAGARTARLDGALAALSPAEQDQLADLAGRVLDGLKRGSGATRWGCRLCDTRACGRDDGRCPVAGPHPPTW